MEDFLSFLQNPQVNIKDFSKRIVHFYANFFYINILNVPYYAFMRTEHLSNPIAVDFCLLLNKAFNEIHKFYNPDEQSNELKDKKRVTELELATKLALEFHDFIIKNKKALDEIKPLPFIESISLKPYIVQTYITQYEPNIKKLSLFFNTASNFIVFLGENSFGKTTILKAIAQSFNHVHVAIRNQPEHKIINSTVSFQGNVNNSNEIRHSLQILAYGASRTSIRSNESMEASEKRDAGVAHLFNEETPLLNIEYWLKIQSELGKNILIEHIFELLSRLVPHLKKIYWGLDPKAGRVLYYEDENGQKCRLKELSAGQKNMVGLVGDILIRLYENQPETISPQELEGIVLIDELEAHLHPRWQRLFPKMLAETFPRVQFVVTTHSPMIVLGMPEDTLYFKVFKDSENYIQAERVDIKAHLLNPQLLLSSDLFGLEPEELKSPALRPEDEHLARTESDMQTLQERDEIRKKLIALSQKHSPNPPNAPKDDKH
jgi:predicted ATPase